MIWLIWIGLALGFFFGRRYANMKHLAMNGNLKQKDKAREVLQGFDQLRTQQISVEDFKMRLANIVRSAPNATHLRETVCLFSSIVMTKDETDFLYSAFEELDE